MKMRNTAFPAREPPSLKRRARADEFYGYYEFRTGDPVRTPI